MSDFRIIALPYCLKRMDDGTYIILNRLYKPLGFDTMKYLNYEDYPICHRIKGINKKTASTLSFCNSDNTDMIYLYGGGCVPTDSSENMRKYLEKIERLAKYQIAIKRNNK